MKKILLSVILASLFISNAVFAQPAANDITGVGFSPQQLAVLTGQWSGTSSVGKFSSDPGLINSDTADGADSKGICINGGGGTSNSAARGSSLCVFGNEDANVGGLTLSTGNAATGDAFVDLVGGSSDFIIRNASAVQKFIVNQGGDVVLPASGNTISVQEATASTACMGVSTPNGNTPVAVTTSCATTGARVFFTRAGAITNMGVITTTTAPSGTGFSFASVGASDTTASSVIWLIVKESA